MNLPMTRSMKPLRILPAVAFAMLLNCHYAPASSPEGAGEKKALAPIEARSGSSVKGEAVFTQKGGKVTLMLTIEGAEPGPHAVHLHEKGDCSAPDAASAGGHWNPAGVNHGKWSAPPFHHGDIGNLEVGADGKGKLELTTDLWSIGGDPKSDILGKAIIVHAKVDDFTTQPTGNAGGRIGCGVVAAGGAK